MKENIYNLLLETINICVSKYNLDIKIPEFTVEVPKEKKFGDFSTNLAFVLSKEFKKSPDETAKIILDNITSNRYIKEIKIAGGGFINFEIDDDYFYQELSKILQEKENYAKENLGDGKKVLVEFVSANPTGPLHIGHGRGAVFGDVLCNLFRFYGYDAVSEYYVNDSRVSLQIENLLNSVLIRCKQILGENIELPEDAYFGEYVIDIAKAVLEKYNNNINIEDEKIINFILQKILDEQKKDLENFNVKFDNFFSEQELYKKDEIQDIMKKFEKEKIIYEKENAIWLYIDGKKDEVIIRSNKKPTYLLSDIAYHKNKFERGYNLLVNIWGADHHGHINRLKKALARLGFDENKIEILITQMVNLIQEGEQIRFSKRSGNIVSLKEVIEEVGVDVARFFFLSKDINSALNFDLQLAKKQEPENPVYYIQYAYARICSIFRNAEKNNIKINENDLDILLLKEDAEKKLLQTLVQFSNITKIAFLNRELYKICNYAISLAGDFHNFYEKCKVIDEKNLKLSSARLKLCRATQNIFKSIFALLGISAKDRM